VSAPPLAVLRAFGVEGARLEPLPGGQRTAWSAGELVLKPADLDARALAWQEEVLAPLRDAHVRVAPPVRAASGALLVDGWTAWRRLAGAHAPRWADVVDAGDRLHRALAGVPRPSALLDARDDPWARADRIAWGEEEPGAAGAVPLVARLLAARRPVAAPAQLVHGDLTGNVLFADPAPPGVVDLSPYWRPPAFAAAVVVVDAVGWHGAPLSLARLVEEREDGAQCLLRALLFRLLTEADPAAQAPRLAPLAERALPPRRGR